MKKNFNLSTNFILIITFLFPFIFQQYCYCQESISIKSKILDEVRTIHIYLPPGYDKTKDKYPVVYILDGGYLINSWPDQPSYASILDSLIINKEIPKIIAIGIMNVDRIRDFNPTHVDTYPTSGGADKFLSFMKEELIHYVDSHYRANSFRILWGHSAGGLLTIYSLLNQLDVFDSYIACSPALSWDSEVVVNLAEKTLQQSTVFNNFLFLSIGGKDIPKFIEATQSLFTLLENQQPRGLFWKKKIYDGLEHMETPEKSFIDGLNATFSQKKK